MGRAISSKSETVLETTMPLEQFRWLPMVRVSLSTTYSYNGLVPT